MHASLPKINSHASTDASSSTAGPSSHMLDVGQEDLEEIRKVYEGWAKSVAFEYCDLRSEGEGAEGYRHVFSKGAFSSSSYHFSPNSRPDLSDANPRRALLVAQISSRSPANPSPNDPSPSPKSSPSSPPTSPSASTAPSSYASTTNESTSSKHSSSALQARRTRTDAMSSTSSCLPSELSSLFPSYLSLLLLRSQEIDSLTCCIFYPLRTIQLQPNAAESQDDDDQRRNVPTQPEPLRRRQSLSLAPRHLAGPWLG
jgi:hypothetical protein